MKLSISKRLALLFALAMALIMSVSAVLLRNSLKESLQGQIRNELALRHFMLDPAVAKYESRADWIGLHKKLDDLTPSDKRVRHWVLAGDTYFSYGDPMPDGQDWSRHPDGTAVMNIADKSPMFLMIKTIPGSAIRPELRFIIGLDYAPFRATLREFTETLIMTSAWAMLLAALVGYWVARAGLTPVRRLSQQANNLPPGDSKKRLDTTALPNELQELATSFNGALSRQEAAWQQLEGFNANVAHELRTPLTNLIGQTQVALAHDRDINELQDLLQSNLEELERMGGIVNDMLFLAGAESGERITELSEVSLQEESSKTVEYLEPVLIEKNLVLAIHGDMRIQVDKRLFHRSLANLLQNAARYAPVSSTLTIHLARKEKHVEISVSNVGEHIDNTHLQRLFERFYRADAARARSDSHHGLGLSIVRAVASMHGGSVFARSENGLNTFGFSVMIDPPTSRVAPA
ncbi:heavy metal sensor histidine kinase [Pseudomonas cichorii]|uniref:Sensor protein n=1 Tax=Pseudomonas cichorii TaxID=36746 RepID=A0A3M4VXL9_PSECI|nr:heavy metal sensor histidine kinase [Pseudomonas cichorii]AHF67285.1 two-component system sensor protein [Pseudomonas cichorii JBC1]QVE19152.1 heavy metal sensor histidine kinase [Pseudomonas cichorii]RMR56608.1 Two-component system sensor protein [Pseudomonas cichorii]SDN54013.1 two-component system, OmpR family, heavy metal sensor histidine kinase CusS [Pseudomonas cichorii]GFM75413.1 two-component sensor histidine kinase [Pseudomonas cichorii]